MGEKNGNGLVAVARDTTVLIKVTGNIKNFIRITYGMDNYCRWENETTEQNPMQRVGGGWIGNISRSGKTRENGN